MEQINREEVIKKSAELQKTIAVAMEQQKELDSIINAPEKPKRTAEQAFIEMVDGCVIWITDHEYPQSVYWMKYGKWMFEQDWENSNFICSYQRVWSVFENEFAMNYQSIQAFIAKMVEERFKLKGLIPFARE